MTGSLRVFTALPPKQPHDHVDLEFGNGVVLRYRDPRRFGAMLWSPGSSPQHRLLAALGVEPFAPEFDSAYLYHATRGRRAAIKLALMDSHVVVGVGNIYANESLFRAGIRPNRSARRVSRAQISRLVDAVRATLSDAIRSQLDRLFMKLRLPRYALVSKDLEDRAARTALHELIETLDAPALSRISPPPAICRRSTSPAISTGRCRRRPATGTRG